MTALIEDMDFDNKMMRQIITAEFPQDPLTVTGERNFERTGPTLESNTATPVQEFFRNATVLVTGGTGFLGIVLTEKLLRSCSHINRLYVLVRTKADRSSRERYEEILRDKLFKRLEYEFPQYREKLTTITGDVTLPNVGLSDENREKLLREVNIIFHCAATVRFHESLSTSLKINAIGTRQMMRLAKDMKNLKVFMYVSTVYCNCPRLRIEEKIYSMNSDYRHLLKSVSLENENDFTIEEATILQDWPNTYVFSKFVTECVIENENDGLPIAIFRPSVILSTYEEPIKGWTNNINGSLGAVLAYGLGILHVYPGNVENSIPDPVPVDYVVNGLICAARETALTHFTSTPNPVPVYNFVNGGRNTITWAKWIDIYHRYGINKQWAFSRMVWYPRVIFVKNRFLYKILSFVLHRLFGYFIDIFTALTQNKMRLTKIYKKLDFEISCTEYFANRSWLFETNRMKRVWNNLSPADKRIFNFDVENIKWKSYGQYIHLGLRLYLLKDNICTLPRARRNFERYDRLFKNPYEINRRKSNA